MGVLEELEMSAQQKWTAEVLIELRTIRKLLEQREVTMQFTDEQKGKTGIEVIPIGINLNAKKLTAILEEAVAKIAALGDEAIEVAIVYPESKA